MFDNVDSGVQTVLENMQTIVASEGGNLEVLSSDDTSIKIKYVN